MQEGISVFGYMFLRCRVTDLSSLLCLVLTRHAHNDIFSIFLNKFMPWEVRFPFFEIFPLSWTFIIISSLLLLPFLLRFFWGWCRTFFLKMSKTGFGRVCHLDFYFCFECMREFRKLLFWLASLYIILTNQRAVLKRAITLCARQPRKWWTPRKDRDRNSLFRDQFGDQMHKRDYLISEFQRACRVTYQMTFGSPTWKEGTGGGRAHAKIHPCQTVPSV